MAVAFTSPVTGRAVSGLTSPTFTLATDTAPPRGVARNYLVTALGGTQTGSTIHTITSPFTIAVKGPSVLKTPAQPGVDGVLRGPVRKNDYEILVRKGAVPLVGQQPRINYLSLKISVEAGCETADLMQLRSALSLLFGAGDQVVNGLIDTIATGAV